MTKKAGASADDQQVIADEQEAERVFQEDAAAVAPRRCDCTALDVPHTHEQGGPVALPEDAR